MTSSRKGRIRLAGLLVVIAAVAAVQGDELPASPAPSPHRVPRAERPAGLDPALAGALRRAKANAAADGVRLEVRSGRRSPEQQAQLFREAVAEHGSEQEAARWVASPETSSHVSGDAIDVGPAEATAWLAEHGARHGLCQIYANEPWHYELRPEAVDRGCPPMYPDPTHDPRMQQP